MKISQMIKDLQEVAKELPNGLDSEVILGDYECNYTCCETVEVQLDERNKAAFIGFELHEDYIDTCMEDEE